MQKTGHSLIMTVVPDTSSKFKVFPPGTMKAWSVMWVHLTALATSISMIKIHVILPTIATAYHLKN